jgi:hypothetical protein|tara:strand:- start:45 stop:233 length:189 start_codon:yes stop_codon:yes gene_type:complete
MSLSNTRKPKPFSVKHYEGFTAGLMKLVDAAYRDKKHFSTLKTWHRFMSIALEDLEQNNEWK